MVPFVNYTCRIYWHFHVALCLSYLFSEIVTCIKQNLYGIKELYLEEAKEIPQKIQPPPKKKRQKLYNKRGQRCPLKHNKERENPIHIVTTSLQLCMMLLRVRPQNLGRKEALEVVQNLISGETTPSKHVRFLSFQFVRVLAQKDKCLIVLPFD